MITKILIVLSVLLVVIALTYISGIILLCDCVNENERPVKPKVKLQ